MIGWASGGRRGDFAEMQMAVHRDEAAGVAKEGPVRTHEPQTAFGAVSTPRAQGVNAAASFAWAALEG